MGGGQSSLSTLYGLASDNLLSLSLVLSNGTLLKVSPNESPEIFWAVAGGGGGTWGVVTDL